MAKRGRPKKTEAVKIPYLSRQALAEKLHEADERTKKARAEFEGLNKACRELEQDCKRADRKNAELAKERDEYQKLAEDRFIMAQTLAKQLVDAEKRITDLLEEIRMYEREHATLRHIIIDALRGQD
jgi:DNA repair exonuclease SbcCD ATPase subunit